MKKSEIIRRYYSEIVAAMVERYRAIVEADGRIQEQIYIWEDGELEYLQGVQGDNSYLKARDAEPRQLYHVWTIDVGPGFDVWDYSEAGAPDDEDEREQMRAEIIVWLVDSYEEIVPDLLDGIIREAEQIERYDETDY